MGITKRLNYSNIFLFIFLALFPFGQIIRVGIFHPIDIVAAVGALYAIINNHKKPSIFKYFENFLFITFITWLISLFAYRDLAVFYGLLYLLRLVVYFYFYIYVLNFTSQRLSNKKLTQDSLLAVVYISAIFGWIQYFTFPDIKPFFTWGWDEHLYRLVGTFLDPTFLGLLVVFGLLITVSSKKLLIGLLLFASLIFTYSRASFLAFLVALPFVLKIKNKLFAWSVITVLLTLTVLSLPTTRNNSINLFRVFSAIARVENYKTTIEIFKKSPIYGIGYNNMCFAYQKFVGPQSYRSHACSGSDSSILFVLATTGVVGLISFTALVFSILKHYWFNKTFIAIFTALMIHGLFSNSFFYSWILGFVLIYLATISNYKTED